MKRYNDTHAITRQPTTISTPHRPLSVEGDVAVPLLQSLVCGVLLAVLATGITWGFFGLPAAPVFLVSLSVGVMASWFWRLGVISETLWSIEEFAGVDIDGDGITGQPHVIRIEQETRTGQQIYELGGIASQDIREFAIVALTGRLNERVVCKKFALSQGDWNGLRDNLITRGVLRWKGAPNSTAGVILTDNGAALMTSVLDHSPTE